ncbi:MAG: NAD(P)-dependent methylenetetrahydromethanopterin dehydrogenase [Methylotenera sp.]|nr:NAD(P)-dependent methylenetetrahydromethanopterin dehydrogenase [Methylotenera sp.]
MEKVKEKVSILHLVTSAKNASPFDVNMAYDAGFDKMMSYTNVALSEVVALTQDAIFSRSASGVRREGIFIGGRDIDLAIQMLTAGKKAMFAPFACSIVADPSGAFTTAAAMIAKVEFHLTKNFGESLAGKTISVFGASGPVGGCAAIIAAKQGAIVQLVAHKSIADLEAKAQTWNTQYQLNMQVVDGASDVTKKAVLLQTEIAICAASTGVRVLTATQIAQSDRLQIIADVNAVAPTGAEGVDAMADGEAIAETKVIGIGALAIGNLKYTTQHNLLKQMLVAEEPCYLEFMAAFEIAQTLVRI